MEKCPLSGKMCECSLVKRQGAEVLAGELNTLVRQITKIQSEIFNNVTGRSAGLLRRQYLKLKRKGLTEEYERVSKKATKYCEEN